MSAFQRADGSVVFHESGDIVRSLFLPCGQCVGCRLERSRQWAMRCMHEASLYDRNCFITLTYDNDHYSSPSLEYRDFQLFMKRLRKAFGRSIRFYMCGEYGARQERPHFHACFFDFDFDDKLYFKRSGGEKLYTSRRLSEIWGKGFCLIGSVTFESAAYVARYCVKKVTGQAAAAHYTSVSAETGEVVVRVPEFNHMSLRPGIGFPWIRKFWDDVYPAGACIVRGRQVMPPKGYDRIFKKYCDADWAMVALARERRGQDAFADNTDERMAVKEQVAEARLSLFVRELE